MNRELFYKVTCLLLLVLVAGPGLAQSSSPRPIIETSLSQSETVPGEAVTVTVTILVPTWLTEPVEFPQVDNTNLSITTPGRSTVSVSREINGNTWSGVTRYYRLIPLAPGRYALPQQNLTLHYKNPQGGDNIQGTVAIPTITLNARAPKGAENLKPFIAATGLTLEQQIDGNPEKLKPGDSFSRTVTATIEGSTVMFLPPMQGTGAPQGIAAYPDTPQAKDTQDGGVRREKVTYVVESAGGGELPAITLRWYNLDTGKIESTEVAAVTVRAGKPPLSSRVSLWNLALLLVGTAMLWMLGWYYARPRFVRWQRQQQTANRETGRTALQHLRTAVSDKDYDGALHAYYAWARHTGNEDDQVRSKLLALGAARYGAAGAADAALWQSLQRAVATLAPTSRRKWAGGLPPLNP
ncbi:BatD family protein [uncultured Microbulbifer sp.]|uniref:BatD family protein n=1 Tax=uncultured Microbulbifer sp. TaxID=348147 RepID=UPI0025EDD459|nr:BatD family protein [uncultured Microbulbifer sp.]